jgi:DNA-binding NarL/FixJ family response regulator
MPPVNPTPPSAVLFVDDEKPFVEAMTQLLGKNLSCPILGYTRPTEALADLPHHEVRVIVTDYSMPDMNGIEFLHRAHALRPEAAAIMITGHQAELAGTDFSRVPGLRETIFKPVSWRTLLERIIKHWPDGNPPLLKDGIAGQW